MSPLGSETNPYLIFEATDFSKIVEYGNPNVYFKLANDITFSSNFTPIDSFLGILDGDGHSINNISINEKGITYDGAGQRCISGFIRRNCGTIKNLYINNMTIHAETVINLNKIR